MGIDVRSVIDIVKEGWGAGLDLLAAAVYMDFGELTFDEEEEY